MSVVLNNNSTLSITAMSLVEFLPEIETAIHNGYMLDLEKNEGVPQSFGSMFVLTMFPAGDVVVSEDTVSVVEDEFSRATLSEQDLPQFTDSEQDVKVNTVTDEKEYSPDVIAPVKVDGRKKK